MSATAMHHMTLESTVSLPAVPVAEKLPIRSLTVMMSDEKHTTPKIIAVSIVWKYQSQS